MQTKNILYLQAELTILETQLAAIMEQDQEEANAGTGEKADSLVSWLALKKSDQTPTADNTQYQKVMEIRRCLKEYCELTHPFMSSTCGRNPPFTPNCPDDALVQQAEINRLSKASRSDHQSLTEWLDHPDGGDMFLKARESFPWRKEHFADLVCLSENSSEVALFTRVCRNGILPLYHRYIGRHIKDPVGGADWSGIYRYSDTRITFFSKVIGTMLASLLPTTSILALYFVKSSLIRLGMIMTFTTTFATTLAVITKGSMLEIFAASTA